MKADAPQVRQGNSKVAAKLLGMRKFSGFLPKAATTLERPRIPVEPKGRLDKGEVRPLAPT